MTTTPSGRRRWFQFSLIEYAVLLTGIAIVWWWIVKESYPHRCAAFFGAINGDTSAALDEFGRDVGIALTLILAAMWFAAIMALRCLGHLCRQWRGHAPRTP